MIKDYALYLSKPLSIKGNIIEACLQSTKIGEICEIHKSQIDPTVIGYAQVIGFNETNTVLSLLNDNTGFNLDIVLLPTGRTFCVDIHSQLPGSILDAMGNVQGRLDGKGITHPHFIDNITIHGSPKDFTQRRSINKPFATGVRAIDTLLTVGQGQRVGIFAAAGCGKTSLMNMLIRHSEADLYIIALIGERVREVTEFIAELTENGKGDKIILVYSTSDRSCVERCNAAKIATTIAEYYSDQGMQVLLFVDSLTRYARALRDVALSAGEVPARQGYPASVFESLPKLLERPGQFIKGSVTAFYTVLIENEDDPDVIAEEVKSILDGHIYLSRNLASKNHYPAIDILNSISRVFNKVTDPSHQKMASRFREMLVRQKDMQLFIDLGEYKRGENAANDVAFDKRELLENFLKQSMSDKTLMQHALEIMYDYLG